MNTAKNNDRYATVAELIERWPIGRTKTYELVMSPDLPQALVLLRERNGRPQSMGFLLSEIVVYEQDFRVHASDLDLVLYQEKSATSEESSPPTVAPPRLRLASRPQCPRYLPFAS